MSLTCQSRFTFRLNEGNCQVDTEDRMQALFQAKLGKMMTYAGLTAKGQDGIYGLLKIHQKRGST